MDMDDPQQQYIDPLKLIVSGNRKNVVDFDTLRFSIFDKHYDFKFTDDEIVLHLDFENRSIVIEKRMVFYKNEILLRDDSFDWKDDFSIHFGKTENGRYDGEVFAAFVGSSPRSEFTARLWFEDDDDFAEYEILIDFEKRQVKFRNAVFSSTQ